MRPVTLSLSIFICFTLCYCQSTEPTIDVSVISSLDGNSKLYLKRKVWGVTSDHQVTTISNSSSSIEDLNPKVDYVYKGLEPFVYRFQSDTLMIYTMQPALEPRDFCVSKIRVIQEKVSNAEYMKLIFEINKGRSEFRKI